MINTLINNMRCNLALEPEERLALIRKIEEDSIFVDGEQYENISVWISGKEEICDSYNGYKTYTKLFFKDEPVPENDGISFIHKIGDKTLHVRFQS